MPAPERKPRGRAVSLAAGVALILLGIPMLICPGPGAATILLGGGLVWYGLTGRESRGR